MVRKIFFAFFCLISACTLASAQAARRPARCAWSARYPLPGVEGRIDHLAADVAGQRVFVAALGNGTVEIVDLAQGKRQRPRSRA